MTFPSESCEFEDGSTRDYPPRNLTVQQAYAAGGIKAGLARAARAAYEVVSRRKAGGGGEGGARLARVLSARDLAALGVGSTLGVGVYVLAGDVARNYAGPAVVLSFLLAAIASIFAGLCYAEFGARVPKAGSAYVYSYVSVGEFIAFVIGWNLILEYIIGAASVVKALSEYLDALVDRAMSGFLRETLPMDSPHLAPYPDIFAFFVIMLFSVGLAFGVKESTRVNNVCTCVNLCVVVFVIISGSFKADLRNWSIPAAEVPAGFGRGGFLPYGAAGVLHGAAVCFYGFIGFDCVATAGEEARNPQRSIPTAVVASLLIVFAAYFGVSAVLTLLLPYYLQDEKAPFPFVYSRLGWPWGKYVVSVGAICALCSSLLGAVFPLPRVVYAMCADGLVFRWLGAVSGRTHTPLRGTLVSGLATGVLAMIFRLEQLIHMMSIGTLLAYSMVASCVLLLRYEKSHSSHRHEGGEGWAAGVGGVWRQLRNADRRAAPTALSSSLVTALVSIYGVWCFVVVWLVRSGHVVSSVAAGLLLVAVLAAISMQPVSEKKLAFSVPFVPWLPGASVLVNVFLMQSLDRETWIRFAVWMAAGLLIYVSYGVWHSSERRRPAEELPLSGGHGPAAGLEPAGGQRPADGHRADSSAALLGPPAAHAYG